MSEPLRKCRVCGLEANTESQLDLFVISKVCLYGRENKCKTCHNEDNKHLHLKQIKFLNKTINLKENPRTNICSSCGKSHPEELKNQTCLHHTDYDLNDALKHTIELCHSCHTKLHWEIRRQRLNKSK